MPGALASAALVAVTLALSLAASVPVRASDSGEPPVFRRGINIGDYLAYPQSPEWPIFRGNRATITDGELERFAAQPPVQRDDTGLEDIARREWRRLRRAAGELADEPEDQELHDLRIRVKRARYAAEFAAPFLADRRERFVTATKALQDVLGDHQDACVAGEQLRTLAQAASSVQAAFAAGRLAEREQARRVAMREQFPAAWERLARAGREAWR